MVFIFQFVNVCITLIDLQLLKNPCIPGIKPTWSWCMIFFKHTCTCKVCQRTMLETRYGEAAVKYLGLDEEDIDELLSSSTNKIVAIEAEL